MSQDAANFYKASEGVGALDETDESPPKTVLEQIGPAPFRSKGFPLLGFLATLYEHVAASAPTSDGKKPDSNTGS